MNKFLKLTILIALIFQFINGKDDIFIQKIASNLGVVWAMDFIDKDNMIFTEKSGKIKLLNIPSGKITTIFKVNNIYNKGQGGLLDIAVPLNNKKIKTIWVSYVNKNSATTLAKAIYSKGKLTNFKNIFVSDSAVHTPYHFGSRITFDYNSLYLSIGDRGIRSSAQDLGNHQGSIIRLNLDGSVPKDNPFVKDKNKLSEIYSFGHRNPQGIFYDKKRNLLFEIEHGPRGGDEINIIQKGKNYGWPIISYGKEYTSNMAVGEGTHKKGLIQPIKVYIPSIAPSSLLVYSGKVFKKWSGNLFSGALKLKHLNMIALDKDYKVVKQERLFKYLNERIRDVVESPDGYIYISTDSGNIYVISGSN